MLSIGYLECKAYELRCEILRLKRKIELIQSRINRREAIDMDSIELELDELFYEYQEELNRRMHQVTEALERKGQERLSKDNLKEFKSLYRSIVKALHPDLNPGRSENQDKLFYRAVEAYENGDLESLRVISTMIDGEDFFEGSLLALNRILDQLHRSIESQRMAIDELESDFPFTMKEFLLDSRKVEEKQEELHQEIVQLKEARQWYCDKIANMTR